MLRGKFWTGAWMWVVRPRRIVFSQTTDSMQFLQTPTEADSPFEPKQVPGRLSNHPDLPEKCPRRGLCKVSTQPRWHSNGTIFKCHQQSQIIEDTVKLSCQPEKLISKHAHWIKLSGLTGLVEHEPNSVHCEATGTGLFTTFVSIYFAIKRVTSCVW